MSEHSRTASTAAEQKLPVAVPSHVEWVLHMCKTARAVILYSAAVACKNRAVAIKATLSEPSSLPSSECCQVSQSSAAEFLKCCLKVRAHVVEKLTETGKGKRLKGFELVKGVHLEPEPFSGVLLHDLAALVACGIIQTGLAWICLRPCAGRAAGHEGS